MWKELIWSPNYGSPGRRNRACVKRLLLTKVLSNSLCLLRFQPPSIFERDVNPPEAIRLSDRPGNFFFNQAFNPVRQLPHHSPTDCFFSRFLPKSFWTKTSVAILRFVRPFFFKDISDWDVKDHTPVSKTGPWYGHWRPRSKSLWDHGMAIDVAIKNYFEEKKTEKSPIRETEVWSLPDQVKNLNAGLRRP